MARGGAGGSRTLLLLALLGILGGFGAWNYQRNMQTERALPRPFRGYSDADIGALADAYRQELDGFARRLEAATGAQVRVADARRLGDQVREFERVQSASRTTRELAAQLAEREGVLAELEREKGKRAEESDKLMLLLRRAFVYRG